MPLEDIWTRTNGFHLDGSGVNGSRLRSAFDRDFHNDRFPSIAYASNARACVPGRAEVEVRSVFPSLPIGIAPADREGGEGVARIEAWMGTR